MPASRSSSFSPAQQGKCCAHGAMAHRQLFCSGFVWEGGNNLITSEVLSRSPPESDIVLSSDKSSQLNIRTFAVLHTNGFVVQSNQPVPAIDTAIDTAIDAAIDAAYQTTDLRGWSNSFYGLPCRPGREDSWSSLNTPHTVLRTYISRPNPSRKKVQREVDLHLWARADHVVLLCGRFVCVQCSIVHGALCRADLSRGGSSQTRNSPAGKQPLSGFFFFCLLSPLPLPYWRVARARARIID